MPLSFLSILSTRHNSRLKFLELRAGDFDSQLHADALFSLGPLEELILQSPHENLSTGLSGWIGSMQDSLKRLDLEVRKASNACRFSTDSHRPQCIAWLEDSMLANLHMPNLKVLTLHDCPEITSAGVAPVLRSSRDSLELLYLGLYGVVSFRSGFVHFPVYSSMAITENAGSYASNVELYARTCQVNNPHIPYFSNISHNPPRIPASSKILSEL